MRAQDKVAIVTGAASGLGLATVRMLTAAGASIVAIGRQATRLEALRDEVPADRLLLHAASVSEEAEVAAAVEAAVARFGRIDIAVNAAGIADAARTVSKGAPASLAVWNRVIATNLTGTFNVIRFAAAKMAANAPDADGERGVIVNTASVAAWQGQVGQAAYSASKAGVIGLTLPVARDLAPLGVRVVTIAPGMFDTEMVAGLPDEVRRATVDRMVLFPGRMGRADEYAALVRSVVENGYLNATTICLDAGARMGTR